MTEGRYGGSIDEDAEDGYRIACIADTHLLPPSMESGASIPTQLASLPDEAAEEVYRERSDAHRHAYEQVTEWLEENGPWDLIVHLGDITGGWQERGMVHDEIEDLTREVKEDLAALAPTRFVPGNHDLGTESPAYPDSGINREAVENYQDVVGGLWWSEQLGDTKIIGLTTPLEEAEEDDDYFERLAEEQRRFLEDELDGYDGDWMLFAHEPSLEQFADLLAGKTDTLQQFVYGDLHNPIGGVCMELYGRLRRMLPGDGEAEAVAEMFEDAHLVPSVAPRWWKGGSVVSIDLPDVEIDREDLPNRGDALPSSSMLYSAFWMGMSLLKQEE